MAYDEIRSLKWWAAGVAYVWADLRGISQEKLARALGLADELQDILIADALDRIGDSMTRL